MNLYNDNYLKMPNYYNPNYYNPNTNIITTVY